MARMFGRALGLRVPVLRGTRLQGRLPSLRLNGDSLRWLGNVVRSQCFGKECCATGGGSQFGHLKIAVFMIFAASASEVGRMIESVRLLNLPSYDALPHKISEMLILA